MSAQLELLLSIRDMDKADSEGIMLIEERGYQFPWTEGIFLDCLAVGYIGRVAESPGFGIVGYGVMSVTMDEAHVLNVCVDPDFAGRGIGRSLMDDLVDTAIEHGAQAMFLEVRPSNRAARRLYKRMGFQRIGLRKGYYPSATGREDAIVYSLLF